MGTRRPFWYKDVEGEDIPADRSSIIILFDSFGLRRRRRDEWFYRMSAF